MDSNPAFPSILYGEKDSTWFIKSQILPFLSHVEHHVVYVTKGQLNPPRNMRLEVCSGRL